MLKRILTTVAHQYFKFKLRGKDRDRGIFRAPWWLDINPQYQRVRRLYWDVVFEGLTEGAEILEGTKITAPGKITLGKGCRVTSDVVLDGRGGLSIGRDTLVGFKSVIISHTHRFDGEGPIIDQGMESAPVHIGDDVWIGAGVYVVPGVTIGDHAIIGARAVVTSDIPPGVIAAGVPAKVKKYRPGFEPEE